MFLTLSLFVKEYGALAVIYRLKHMALARGSFA
jgi:hypothetical protein